MNNKLFVDTSIFCNRIYELRFKFHREYCVLSDEIANSIIYRFSNFTNFHLVK